MQSNCCGIRYDNTSTKVGKVLAGNLKLYFMSTKTAKATLTVEVNKTNYLMVSPELIIVDAKENPRQDYGNIEELMASILENGIRTPFNVYEKDGKYVLKTASEECGL